MAINTLSIWRVKFDNYLKLCDNSRTRTVTKSWQKQKYQSSTSGIFFCLICKLSNSGYLSLSPFSSHFLTIHSEMTLPIIVISKGARITVTKISKNSPPN